MMNASRRTGSRAARSIASLTVLCGTLLAMTLLVSSALAQAPLSGLDKQLDRIDLGVSGIGQFQPTTSGTTYLPQNLSQTPSNTLGALIELRYIKSPLVGIEANYTYARYTENYTLTNTTGTPKSQLPYILGVQTKADEGSLGYVAHGPTVFGLKPFGGAGAGWMEFKPTSGGGEGLPRQVRAAFYYQVGVEQTLFSEHFGVRVQFRQVFFGSPDFTQNYLATGARTISTQPGAGFYLHF